MSEIYQLALNKSTGGILIINDQLQIEFINDWLGQALNISVTSSDRVLLRDMPQAKEVRFLDAVNAALERGVASRLSATFNPNLLQLIDPVSGQSLTHSTNISRLASEGKHYCLVNVVDETKPLKREKLLSDYIQKLKETESELQLSRDVAIKACKVKTEFIASASHQLRTPLNAIVGFSELLVNGALGDLNQEQKDSVKDIFDAGKLLSDVVTQMLFISDSASSAASQPEPVAVGAELQNLLNQLSTESPLSHLQVSSGNFPQTVVNINQRLLQALLKNVLIITATCQRENLAVYLYSDAQNQLILRFHGDWLGCKLACDEDAGRIVQMSEQPLNTEGDMRFLLELSHQLAELAGISLDFQESEGLRLIFTHFTV